MTEAAPSNGEIFIVDDDPAIRQMLSIVFAQAGFHATCFAEGAALLASTRTVVPACIILDVNIPGRSGLDILKQLNAEDYPAPIFVISGEGDIPMAVDAIRNGALDFIEKPFRAAPSSARSRRASRPGDSASRTPPPTARPRWEFRAASRSPAASATC